MSAHLILRRADWAERLHQYVHARRAVPFAWGGNDCATFAAGAVEAMTDARPLAGLGSWHNAAGAAQCLAKVGGLEAALTGRFGEPTQDLRRGDLVLVPADEEGPRVAVVLNGKACGPGPGGLVWAPLQAPLLGWRVG